MTNSEEPSAPDGISSMSSASSFKLTESYGAHHNANQNHNNVDVMKHAIGNGLSSVPPEPSTSSSSSFLLGTGLPTDSPPLNLTSVSLYGSSFEQDSYILQLPSSANNQQHTSSVQQLGLPFTLICGEVLEHKAEISDGTLALTNYRLFLQTKENTFNLPLGLVEQVECRDIFFVHLNCKDARSIKCTFPNNEAALEMMRRIQGAISPPKKMEEAFAFSFYQMTKDVSEEVKAQLGWELPPFPTPEERFDAEIKRMEFNIHGPWRVSKENKDFELCNSYPRYIIVPCVMDKKKLEQVSSFRSARRFPAVVWRHKGNGAVISRCSQPEVGWFGWRSNEDEELVQSIVLACADNGKSLAAESGSRTERIEIPDSPGAGSYDSSSSLPAAPCGSLSSIEVVPDPPNLKKLLILDARSYTTAVANRARGGGCECLEYYTNCEIQFMSLANIHSIRKSFINVRQLCAHPTDQTNWYSLLENCKWLQHMSGLMKAAITVATAIENEGRPVMVHCSDGWDRTPQIVALAEILLDPYYRSLEGFQVLVEREWLDFGHKFADRCGQGVGSDDTNERCPVFLQWLDCLHQLIRQFPTAFEFNLSFLVKLAQHTYSNLFGTFLCNTAKERQKHGIEKSTHSIWRFLRAPSNYEKFRNNLYTSCDKVLWPCYEVRELSLWTQVFMGYDNPQPFLAEVMNPSQESSPAPSVAADFETTDMSSGKSHEKSKGRSSSCENIHTAHLAGLHRRQSDPNLSDSFLGADLDEIEIRFEPHAEKLLNSASEDVNEDSKGIDKNLGNGNLEGEDISENEDTETNSDGKSEATVNILKSIESSTDTLVAELGVMTDSSNQLKTLGSELPNKTDSTIVAESSNTSNRSRSPMAREKTESENSLVVELTEATKDPENPSRWVEGDEGTCEVCETSRKLLLGDAVNASTSGSTSTNSTNGVQVVPVPTSTGTNASSSGYGSKFSSYNTPLHSRTPSTGVPATPEETSSKPCFQQEKWQPEAMYPQQGNNPSSSTKSPYDVDGLAPLHDEVQSRLHSIISNYKGQIETLQRELQMTRDALMKQVCHKCTHMTDRPDDTASVADSVENHSVGHESHGSEKSWEAVEEKDTRPPLWVPDYAATHCMGCCQLFWLGRRKHHCRMCGKIFCADCSENTVTLPSEQLFDVRVCNSCHERLAPSFHCHGLNAPTSFHNGNSCTNHHLDDHRNKPNGVHRGTISDIIPAIGNVSLSHRRLSEDLPRTHRSHQQQWHSKSAIDPATRTTTSASSNGSVVTTSKDKSKPSKSCMDNGSSPTTTPMPRTAPININGKSSHET